MRIGILGSLTALLASTGLALAQPEAPPTVPPPPTAPAPGEESQPPLSPPAPGTPDGGGYPGYPAHPPLNPYIPPRTTPPSYPESTEDSRPEQWGRYCWYGGAEYLNWWMKSFPVPPLLTTGTSASRGALGAPGTQVLIGEQSFTNQEVTGGRFTLGAWLDQCTSIEGSYFTVSEGTGIAVSSPGTRVLGRPFFNVVTNMEDAAAVSLPGLVNGGVAVQQDTRFWGAEANYRCQLKHGCWYHWDALVGVRYLNLQEGLTINESLAINPGVPVIGGLAAVALDNFETRNNFYGAQVGTEAEVSYGRIFFNARAKLAMGTGIETAIIRGESQQLGARPGAPVEGGLLALPTNIGKHTRSLFVVAPEAGANLGYVVTDWLRVSVGYSFLYMSQVLRPGNQIDFGINPAQGIPGSFGTRMPAIPPRPAYQFRESDFWVQGISVNVEFRF